MHIFIGYTLQLRGHFARHRSHTTTPAMRWVTVTRPACGVGMLTGWVSQVGQLAANYNKTYWCNCVYIVMFPK